MKSSDKLKLIRIILIALTVLCTAFIFVNSFLDASRSSAESFKIIQFLRPVLEKLKIPQENWQHYVRKAAHFTEFFVIGLLLSAVFRGRRIFLPLLIGFLIAAADETIQLFVPGRSGEFSDMLLDTAGAFIAILIVRGAAYLHNRRKRSDNTK